MVSGEKRETVGGRNGVVREEMVCEEGDGVLRKEIDVRTVEGMPGGRRQCYEEKGDRMSRENGK